MAPQTINVLLSSFPGLSLPPTLSIPLPSTSTIGDLTDAISSYLPASLNPRNSDLVLTTLNNKNILPLSDNLLASLLPASRENADSSPSTLLPMRLSVPIRGGKGGFGSQLRAAGGRMSSKNKRNQGENNGSNRNLDGRRIRTVNEAKALAEYLAVKPDMDRKQKEERRKRWEMVVEAAERREEEVRNGGGAAGKSRGKVDGAWMEDKEEMGEKAREAVLRAMKDGAWKDNLGGATVGGSSSSSAAEGSGSGSPASSEESDEDMENANEVANSTKAKAPAARKFIGFDDDDEFMSSDEEDEEAENDNGESDEPEGKGKGRA
ncbi:hypothetical protein FQN54_004645 [Arachnomyces sp. PD_36]|nr:hypothetical protein FQN54_004645 [Arachnomyces sp. PD_36]